MLEYAAQAIVGAILLGSILVWWRAWQIWQSGQPLLPWRHRKPGVWSPLAAALVVAWLVLFQIAPLLVAAQPDRPEPLVRVQQTVGASLFAVLILLATLAGSPRGRLSDFGIDLRNAWEQARTGTIGFLAAWLPVLLVLLATLPLRDQQAHNPMLQFLQDDPDPVLVAWIVLAAVVAAPLSEELMFRVVLQGALEQFLPPAAAIGITAILFSAVHPWPDMLPLVPLAIVLGYVFYRTRSYLAVVILHALFNAVNLLMALATEQVPPPG